MPNLRVTGAIWTPKSLTVDVYRPNSPFQARYPPRQANKLIDRMSGVRLVRTWGDGSGRREFLQDIRAATGDRPASITRLCFWGLNVQRTLSLPWEVTYCQSLYDLTSVELARRGDLMDLAAINPLFAAGAAVTFTYCEMACLDGRGNCDGTGVDQPETGLSQFFKTLWPNVQNVTESRSTHLTCSPPG
jgi:hypothetical protein